MQIVVPVDQEEGLGVSFLLTCFEESCTQGQASLPSQATFPSRIGRIGRTNWALRNLCIGHDWNPRPTMSGRGRENSIFTWPQTCIVTLPVPFAWFGMGFGAIWTTFQQGRPLWDRDHPTVGATSPCLAPGEPKRWTEGWHGAGGPLAQWLDWYNSLFSRRVSNWKVSLFWYTPR